MSGARSTDGHEHFIELRDRINGRLLEIGAKYADVQVRRYPWLVGALGQVPSSIAFICENPSLAGVESAHAQTIDGGPPDIEAQWWGGPTDPAATRLRVVLHELGLKCTPPAARGGWRCYITNVIKEADVAKDHGALDRASKLARARAWADVLSWELEKVNPQTVVCVGGRAADLVASLQDERLLPRFTSHKIWHYSARGAHETVRSKMASGIRAALSTVDA